MLRIRNLSNQYQKRTLRILLGHTQATPYPGTLDPSLRNTDGSFRAPLAADTVPLARSANAFLLQGGLVPGQVLVKGAGESFVVHNGVAGVRPFGLLGNHVGGTIDDLGDENQIGVWYGKDALVEVLAPAFDDTGLAAAYSAATAGNPVRLYAGVDGRLTATAPTGLDDTAPASDFITSANNVVGYLVERNSASKITVRLAV